MNHPLFDTRRYLIPFRSSLLPQIFCDTLVIGAGVAGARAAIAAAEKLTSAGGGNGGVIVLAKEEPLGGVSAGGVSPNRSGGMSPGGNNTAWAQGGIAAVFDSSDTVESHLRDTLVAGAGMCDEPIARLVVEEGPARVREIIDWGMRFDLGPDGKPVLGREGGHSLSRILHSQGDATGRELMRCLWERLNQTQGVRVFTKCFALDLITAGTGGGEGGSPVMGAITHHPKYGLQMIWAKSTILASGGAGMLYRETTNPKVATGDGVALAYRAGATVADMAFVQFHPTCLYIAGAARWLITEAVRGAGAYLVDESGERFMVGEHELAELAPRDVVTRGIVRRLTARGGTHVHLDCRHIAEFSSKFPGITKLLAGFDLDPSRDLIPVHPAAHYSIGGVLTDAFGRSDVPGLFAAGECSCSGLHGANRLASNSLLEGLVMGEAAGRAAASRALGEVPEGETPGGGWSAPVRAMPVAVVSDIRPPESAELDLSDVLSSLRSAMWRNCGIERRGPRLGDLVHMLEFWGQYTLDKIFDDVRAWEVQNMLLTAWLTARSAQWRGESRGCHWREEFKGPKDELRSHDCWKRGRSEPVLKRIVGGGG